MVNPPPICRGKEKYLLKKKKREDLQKAEKPARRLTEAPPPPVAKGDAKADLPTVHLMTSRDFHLDLNARIEIAMETLKDVRNNYFRKAILHNRHLFRDRTVLNLGCNMGLHAMFAAKAGAKKVYAVDDSHVVEYTRQVVAANGYADVIHVIKARVQLLELPVAKVDVIICDWEGNSLLFDSQLDNVIYARDKWLKPGGVILPDAAKLHLVAVEDAHRRNERIEYWINVYGFNMKAIRNYAISEPFYQSIQQEKLISRPSLIKMVDVYKVTAADLKIDTQFELNIKRAGNIDALLTYSTISFKACHVPITFTSAPNATDSRWVNALYFLNERVGVVEGENILGALRLASRENGDLSNMSMLVELVREKSWNLAAQMWWRLKLSYISDRTLPADAKPVQVAELNNNRAFDMNRLEGDLPK